MKLQDILPSLLLILDKNVWQEAINDVNLVDKIFITTPSELATSIIAQAVDRGLIKEAQAQKFEVALTKLLSEIAFNQSSLSDKIALGTAIIAVPILNMTVGAPANVIAKIPAPIEKIFENIFKGNFATVSAIETFLIFALVDFGIDAIDWLADPARFKKAFAKIKDKIGK
jgi:hypothetical protein